MSSGSFTDGIDAAYLLLSQNDWTQGLRGNRWHWAKRWALHVPTVIVEPDQEGEMRPATTTAEPRIPNARILHVTHCLHDEAGLAQAAQIAADMDAHGFQRPLLWSYNPEMAIAFGAVPAGGRLYHATENYFDFEHLPRDFLAHLRASVSAADLVVAVSRGVANGFEAHTEAKATVVVTNGVDYRDYAGAPPDPSLRDLGHRFRRIAIYAGNVNSRVDFDLLNECVRRFEDTLFVFYGRVRLPDLVRAAAWQDLIARANTDFLGEVPADRLPALYSAADVGIIPYTQDPLLVENGFPLKALEMGAAGLPVVSTHMKCISGLSRALDVAETSEEFVRALGKRLQKGLTSAERDELDLVCRRNDYDVKFEEALAALNAQLEPDAPVTVRIDAALTVAIDQWRTVLQHHINSVFRNGESARSGRVIRTLKISRELGRRILQAGRSFARNGLHAPNGILEVVRRRVLHEPVAGSVARRGFQGECERVRTVRGDSSHESPRLSCGNLSRSDR